MRLSSRSVGQSLGWSYRVGHCPNTRQNFFLLWDRLGMRWKKKEWVRVLGEGEGRSRILIFPRLLTLLALSFDIVVDDVAVVASLTHALVEVK